MTLSRRQFNGGLVLGGLGLALARGCRSPAVLTECPVLPADRTDWVSIALADHPSLAAPGGAAAVQVPEALLDVVVVHQPEGCFVALWRDCTHGSCQVEYAPEQRALHCPCHGSLFEEDGAVREGPATEPLRAFPVAREGDMLWIYRPI